jgi:hypothetical protein
MVKTTELTGQALDWAVAKCEGVAVVKYPESRSLFFGAGFDKYSPSTNWSQGGPIIEREGIHLTTRAGVHKQTGEWSAQAGWAGDITLHGETPLIAAMRCYVYQQAGSEVDIPESLL